MFVGTQTADNVSRGGKYEEIEWMYTCGPQISQCPAMDGQTISLDNFRSQYVERVLALLGEMSIRRHRLWVYLIGRSKPSSGMRVRVRKILYYNYFIRVGPFYSRSVS